MFPSEAVFFQTLQKQHYVHLPFLLDPQLLQQAMDAFFVFLEEPESIKHHIDFTIAPMHRRGDVGFKYRRADEGIYNDNKSFLQFNPAIFDRYGDFLAQNPRVSDLVHKAKPIWDMVALTIRQVLNLCDTRFPGVVNRVFAKGEDHILLRFLKYDWQSSGKYLAKPHFDAGSCTLAIAESCAGLRIGSCPDDLALVQHKEQQALFMLSSNFRQLLPCDSLSAGWHDVVQLDEAQLGKPFARWALVAFIEAAGVEALPRTETHKWYKPESVQ
jgi:hypothetical protein